MLEFQRAATDLLGVLAHNAGIRCPAARIPPGLECCLDDRSPDGIVLTAAAG
jgi:hypothetical protein